MLIFQKCFQVILVLHEEIYLPSYPGSPRLKNNRSSVNRLYGENPQRVHK